MKKTVFSIITAIGLGLSGAAFAAGAPSGKIENIDFSFDGPFGRYDQEQLRRGLKVYTEVCSACHGLRQVAFRTLGDKNGPGYSAEEVKAYASEFPINDEASNPQYYDAENDEYRTLVASDKFPAHNAAGAPDLSLMAKARAGFHGPHGLGINQMMKGMGGPEYLVALLTGYTGEEKEEAGTTLYENKAFPGGWISMAPPLYGEDIDFDDGHANDLYHLSEDLAAFLMWTAEPKMMERKQFGFKAFLFLGVFGVLLYFTNKKLWAPIKRKQVNY